MSKEGKHRIAERLAEVGLGTERFIQVQPGEKSSIDHQNRAADDVEGNYGIYARGDDALCILDIDDYGDLEDKSGLAALAQLPPTLEQKSPHGGTHRLYKVTPTDDGRLVAAALDDAFGTSNPNPSWGEVRAKNQYVVGAGSQLDGCSKEWCEECAKDDGGHYVVREGTAIATIDSESLISALAADPSLSTSTDDAQSSLEDVDNEAGETPSPPDDVDERLAYARERDDKLDRLMRGDYSDYRDSDAKTGVDRSAAEFALASKLAFWLGDDTHTIRRVIEHDANTQKWDERPDDSYREWVLGGVDVQTEFYTPSQREQEEHYAPDVDWEEVDRGEAILRAETGITDPAGALVHRNGCYGYLKTKTDDDGEMYKEFAEVTNFTLETLSYIETYEGELLTIRVHPSSPIEDAFDVQVHPTVFNETASFKEEIVRGRTTRYDPQGRHNKALNDLKLTVGSQMAPKHQGTEYIGLHGDSYDEWVTPKGTLTADGWSDEPEYKYYEKGGEEEMQSSLEEKWQLDADDGAAFDESEVREILKRVPKTRLPERGLPILGWFYAAPLKPYIHDIEGEFNLLQVTGDTEAGKTATLGMFYQMFGSDPAPFGCGDTAFTIEKKLGSSCGLPIWLDEYKPSDLASGKLKWLHRRLREVTREKHVSKGRASLGEVTFKMRAPVVFSGEQTVKEAAVRRRTVMTNLTNEAKTRERQQAFCELTGASYTDASGDEQYPMGMDLSQHAIAYYKHVLSLTPAEVDEAWQTARKRTGEYLQDLGVSVDGTEFKGMQTIVFGVAVYKQFAASVGVDESQLPTDYDVKSALEHVTSNIGPDGRRREHIDEFAELLVQAASAGYIEEGKHHRILDSQKYDGRVLAFHMPTTFSAVKKYVREYNLEDEYSLLGKNDYLDSFRDKSKASDSYPLAVNQRVRGLENGAKAVYLDPEAADRTLPDGFNLNAFVAGAEQRDGDGNRVDAIPLDDLDGTDGLKTVTAELVQTYREDMKKPWYEREGWLVDTSGAAKFIVRAEFEDDLEVGKCYKLSNVTAYPEDGVIAVETVPGVTTIEEIEAGDGHTHEDESDFAKATSPEPKPAETDGGVHEVKAGDVEESEELAGTGTVEDDAHGPAADAKRLAYILATQHGDMQKQALFAKAGTQYGMSPEDAEKALDKATTEGSLTLEGGRVSR